jgi:ferredoxin
MTCKIFYFSGTGNSLHVARKISDKIPNSIIVPIVSLLSQRSIDPSADIVGIVFPIYTNTVPYQVREFLKELELSQVKYVFSIATHGGVVNVPFTRIYLKKAIEARSGKLSYFRDIEMLINNPTGIIPSFIPVNKDWPDQISQSKIDDMVKRVEKEIDDIVSSIIRRKNNIGKEKLRDRFLERGFSEIAGGTGKEIAFFSDNSCTSCGICEKVCLSGTCLLISPFQCYSFV